MYSLAPVRLRDELLTHRLEPAQLAADKALTLDPYGWRIERLRFDLKEVLNINRLYADPNAVARPVDAATIVYNAMWVVQGEVAEAAGMPPE